MKNNLVVRPDQLTAYGKQLHFFKLSKKVQHIKMRCKTRKVERWSQFQRQWLSVPLYFPFLLGFFFAMQCRAVECWSTEVLFAPHTPTLPSSLRCPSPRELLTIPDPEESAGSDSKGKSRGVGTWRLIWPLTEVTVFAQWGPWKHSAAIT